MSGASNRRPEFMILIAVLVALVAGIIGMVASCGILAAASGPAVERLGTLPGNDPGDILDSIIPHDDNGSSSSSGGSDGSWGYTEKDVPDEMDIDVPELQDDLQALINHDIQYTLGLQGKDVKVTDLAKDDVSKPELKNGQVLSQVSGKAAIENADGETATIDYTSYYYADDPTADKITWYIYAYDLGSYDLFPSGFKEKSGDPMGIRDYLQKGDSPEASKTDLSHDKGRDAETA